MNTGNIRAKEGKKAVSIKHTRGAEKSVKSNTTKQQGALFIVGKDRGRQERWVGRGEAERCSTMI